MFKYIVKRLASSLLTLFIVVSFVFGLLRLMPETGYFDATEYDKMDEFQIEQALTNMGLRDPFPVQLFNFWKSVLTLDFGRSTRYHPNVDVVDIVLPKIPFSLMFGLGAMVVELVLGITLGVAMGRKLNGFMDRLGNGYIVLMKAMPGAVIHLFVQVFISSFLGLPMLFNPEKPISWLLPITSMALGGISGYAMWVRRYVVDQMTGDYVKFARSKGVSSWKLMFQHVLRNAFVPMSHNIPINILATISGSLYVEGLYSIPGTGGLLIQAIKAQDNPLVQILVLMYSSIGVFGLFLGDLMLMLCDPRIKLTTKGESR